MKKVEYWREMERITKARISDLSVAILHAKTGHSLRWLQATLETNYNFNLLAKQVLDSIEAISKQEHEREMMRQIQFRANDDE